MPNTVRTMYCFKDKLKGTETHVYSLECKTCKGKYIGETQRAWAVREKERRDAVRLGNIDVSGS